MQNNVIIFSIKHQSAFRTTFHLGCIQNNLIQKKKNSFGFQSTYSSFSSILSLKKSTFSKLFQKQGF